MESLNAEGKSSERIIDFELLAIPNSTRLRAKFRNELVVVDSWITAPERHKMSASNLQRRFLDMTGLLGRLSGDALVPE